MKIWVKLLIGIIIGALLALLLEGERVLETFEAISEAVINIGRYLLFPLVLLGAAIGTYELRREKLSLRVLGRLLLYLVGSGVLLAAVGTLSTVVLSPDRIPIAIEEVVVYSVPTLREILEMVFPRNLFLVFTNPGNYLLPIFAFACLLGLNLNFDRLATRPSTQLIDSLTRVFYNMNAFFFEIIGIGFIPLTAAMIMRLMRMPELALFRQLVLVLFIDSLLVVFVIYPLVLYFLAGKRNPFVWLYAALGSVLTAIVTGDSYFSLAAMIRHEKENFGVPRSIGSIGLPLFTLFGRAGTAMVTGASFVLIIVSYSSLGITVGQTLWVMLFAFLASFLVGPFPGIGVFVALSVLSSGFAGGYQEGYLILKPVVPVLMSFAVALDVLTTSLATALVAHHTGTRKEVEPMDFA